MENLKLRVTLSDHTRGNCQEPKIYCIKRGESWDFWYDLGTSVGELNVVDQFTVIFKQNNKFTSYSMFTYLIPATEISPDEEYYNITQTYSDNHVDAVKVDDPQTLDDLFVAVDGEDYERSNTWWFLDDHFTPSEKLICFRLSSEETLALALTTPYSPMLLEVVIRADTDDISDTHYRDSTIIESQPPVMVVDSLYSQMQ